MVINQTVSLLAKCIVYSHTVCLGWWYPYDLLLAAPTGTLLIVTYS